jgi:hypothetical protein
MPDGATRQAVPRALDGQHHRLHRALVRDKPGKRWAYASGAPYWLGLFFHEEPTRAP